MNEIVLYAYNFRSRSERVLWTLRELEMPNRVVRLDLAKGENQTLEFLQLNPAGTLPVLVHGNAVLTESLAIMEYLNDISTSQCLVPKDTQERYKFRQVLHYGLTAVEPYLWVADQVTRLGERYSWPDGALTEALRQARHNIALVWTWVRPQSYLVGDTFTLADIFFYHLITWSQQYQFDVPEHVEQYLRVLESRKSFPPEMHGIF